jgi:hypothetical protein
MACNCKKALELQKKGTRVRESVFEKCVRYGLKSVLFVITLAVGIILTPVIFVAAIYKLCFGDMSKPMVVPKFLSNIVKKHYGEKL